MAFAGKVVEDHFVGHGGGLCYLEMKLVLELSIQVKETQGLM